MNKITDSTITHCHAADRNSTSGFRKFLHHLRCHWKRTLIIVILSIAILFLAKGFYLLYPYINLPHVTTADLDALDLNGYDRVMFVAHPDDDLLWGGRHLIEDDYLVVCMTRGNDPVRSAEFKSVMEAIGDKYLILSYPDKIGKRRSTWTFWKKDMEADIATVLNYKDWTQVATHNPHGEYGHQHHQMTHELVEKVYKETGCKADFYSFGKYYVNDKVPYDLEEMPKDLYIQKRKLASLYTSQRTTVRKMYHMLPYEYWQKENY